MTDTKPEDYRTLIFKIACGAIHYCRNVYGKPWTCTRQDVTQVAHFLYGDDSTDLGPWNHAKELLLEGQTVVRKNMIMQAIAEQEEKTE